MTDGTSEQALFGVQAQVLIYDDAARQWTHAGSSGEAGPSKVQIYHHVVNNTFRVVARRLQDREVVINSSIAKNMKYSQATSNFHQWRDRQGIYGVNFSSPEDAEAFAQHILYIVDSLNAANQQLPSSGNRTLPASTAAPNTRSVPNGYEDSGDLSTNEDDHQSQSVDSQLSAGLRTLVPAASADAKRKSGSISKPETPSPMAPPTVPPTLTSTSAASSTPSGGVCPPPPPPPPGPAVGGVKKQRGEVGVVEGGGLAAALQSAQLKKVAQSAADSDQQPSSSSNSGSVAFARASVAGGGSGGGGGGDPVDMMSEMAKKLQARKSKTERGGSGGPGGIGATSPQTDSEPGSCGQIEPPFRKSKAPGFTLVKKLSITSAVPSPTAGLSSISRASVRPISSGPALNGSTSSSSNLETLKQEILVEISTELNKIKDEIIDVIKAELNKQSMDERRE